MNNPFASPNFTINRDIAPSKPYTHTVRVVNKYNHKLFQLFEVMAAAPKSVSGSQLALFVLLVVANLSLMARAQSSACTAELTNLNVCAPFVVPGASNTKPSASCCNALQAMDPDCLCNTLRIASQLPSQCQIQSLTCGTLLLLNLFINT